MGGGMRVPGVGALLLQALDTYIDRRLQNIFICGHGPTAGFLPPTWQGGGHVGDRKTRQGQGHTAGKTVTMAGGRFTPRSLAINTPEHLCARNWGPQNRGLSPCLQSRGDFPSTGLPQKGERRTEARCQEGRSPCRAGGALAGGSGGWGVVSSVRAGAWGSMLGQGKVRASVWWTCGPWTWRAF